MYGSLIATANLIILQNLYISNPVSSVPMYDIALKSHRSMYMDAFLWENPNPDF